MVLKLVSQDYEKQFLIPSWVKSTIMGIIQGPGIPAPSTPSHLVKKQQGSRRGGAGISGE